tara:strand:+ start:536 stop:763 length:228 start_codon:yes stop_codon:yes gene_type:complete
MKCINYTLITMILSGCSLNDDSKYWIKHSVENKNKQILLERILKKTSDIRTLTIEEYEIYIDDYVKKGKYPNINK